MDIQKESRFLQLLRGVSLKCYENPYADPARGAQVVGAAAHQKLARRIAQESIILLKNEGGLLPLDRGIGSIAVIGPNADRPQCGDYTALKPGIVTPLQGIRSAVSARTDVRYAMGCDVFGLTTEGFGEEGAGKEVVRLYVNDKISSVTTPVKELKRFRKIDLKPGEQKTVTFELTPRDLMLLNEDMNWVVEPGAFEVMVGGLKKTFEVMRPD